MNDTNTSAARLAELVLSMDMVTEKGIRARALAREVLNTEGDALTTLRLIEHATAPTHEDGGHHEAAHELATAAIARLAAGAPPLTDAKLAKIADDFGVPLTWLEGIARAVLAAASAGVAPTELTDELQQVAAFLDGSAPLDGVWFGDRHPTFPGQFWWRSFLRRALATRAAKPVAWTLKETLEKGETTTTGHLWFTDPQNSGWAPLYTAPQDARAEPAGGRVDEREALRYLEARERGGAVSIDDVRAALSAPQDARADPDAREALDDEEVDALLDEWASAHDLLPDFVGDIRPELRRLVRAAPAWAANDLAAARASLSAHTDGATSASPSSASSGR